MVGAGSVDSFSTLVEKTVSNVDVKIVATGCENTSVAVGSKEEIVLDAVSLSLMLDCRSDDVDCSNEE